jgi:hypothetical protein
MKLLLAIVGCLMINLCCAETYLQINGASIHDKSGYNQFNYGASVLGLHLRVLIN